VAFENKFLSIAGQVERLKNVGAVLTQSLNPFSKAKPTVNEEMVKNPVIKAAATALVQHPYVTAAVAAAPFSSGARSAAAGVFKSLSPLQKIGTVAAAAVTIPAIVKSPKAASKTIEAVSSTPAGLVNFGGNVGSFIENPSVSSLKNVFTENPLISTGAAAVVAAPFLGFAVKAGTSLVGSALVREELGDVKELVKEQKEIKNNSPSEQEPSYNVVDKSGGYKSDQINQAITEPAPPVPLTQTVSKSSGGALRRRPRRTRPTPNINVRQAVNVLISNKSASKTYLNKGIYR